MKRFVPALAGLFALGWSGMAFAQAASTITTACLTSFTCAFTAAETLSLVAPKSAGSPGQPDVFVGYMGFDGSGNFTMTGSQNLNGTVNAFSKMGKCASGTVGVPAVITLEDNSQLSYVLDSGMSELQFILTNDASTNKTANSVRVGVCRKL